MLFPVLAPSISASSSRSSDSAAPPPRRVASTETTTSSRSLSNWFSGLKRRNSYDLEEKLVKAVTKLDRREREKREKAMKKHEKEQKLKMRKEQDSRAYAAWLKEQRIYYSGGRQGDRKPEDDEFYPHGVWTGAYLF